MVNKILYVVVEDMNLMAWYQSRANIHNNNIANNNYSDSGFDLACPYNCSLRGNQKINLMVRAAMYSFPLNFELNNIPQSLTPSAYYLYPRSSMSTTPFRLANSVGIIDSGYRGPLGVYLDGNGDVTQFQRLIQICSPTLEPFFVVFTNELALTERNQGGFGSTGR
jgi:hypothetical protein